jgi:hypothetical protein
VNYKLTVYYTVEIMLGKDTLRLECATLREAQTLTSALRGTRCETDQTVNLVAWDSRNDADGGPNGLILDQFNLEKAWS